MRLYNPDYCARPHIVALNKMDLQEASQLQEEITAEVQAMAQKIMVSLGCLSCDDPWQMTLHCHLKLLIAVRSGFVLHRQSREFHGLVADVQPSILYCSRQPSESAYSILASIQILCLNAVIEL